VAVTAARKPVVSVLYPVNRPSRTTTVLTAPISAGPGDNLEQIDHGFPYRESDVDPAKTSRRTPSAGLQLISPGARDCDQLIVQPHPHASAACSAAQATPSVRSALRSIR